MFEDFMNHRCNIYHLEDGTVDVGYGIKERTVKNGKVKAMPQRLIFQRVCQKVKIGSVMIKRG